MMIDTAENRVISFYSKIVFSNIVGTDDETF
jgi:hypothetical protein